jgi:hypothetical protein
VKKKRCKEWEVSKWEATMDTGQVLNLAIFYSLGLIALIIFLIMYFIPLTQIVRKAGYSGWWVLVLFVPLLNMVMLWVFAFASWPNLRDRPN